MSFNLTSLEEILHPHVAAVPHFDASNVSNDTDRLLLEVPTLKWLPWIGQKYQALPSYQKILVVGESHYYEESEGAHSFHKHQRNGYTRHAVQTMAVEREYRRNGNNAGKIYPNFHRTLFGNDRFESKLFWENVCYYNFIQVPMRGKQSRPDKSQYQSGWSVFSTVVNVLRPSYCFFLGNSSSKYFPETFAGEIAILQGISGAGWDCKAKRASYKATIRLHDETEVTLKFLPHPSKFYSWEAWSDNVKRCYPDLMAWLLTLTGEG